jgi:hypothetical protein
VNYKRAEQNNTLIITAWTKRTRNKDGTRRVEVTKSKYYTRSLRVVPVVKMLLEALR